MPLLSEPSPFIRAWDRLEGAVDCTPSRLGQQSLIRCLQSHILWSDQILCEFNSRLVINVVVIKTNANSNHLDVSELPIAWLSGPSARLSGLLGPVSRLSELLDPPKLPGAWLSGP